ncbi:probable E3 ubiquitin-protein ligase RNF144A [Megalops cyprinoides]|uniref:probable E3 ubiquitin-protein ligase RNF144A n=1 Tax=Megalops cyprinoides TaxID=118141 RepID=UPI001865392A|nr:probable E3 ubiquitin-protein ligase RNF144A [Megalops cyprinoides]
MRPGRTMGNSVGTPGPQGYENNPSHYQAYLKCPACPGVLLCPLNSEGQPYQFSQCSQMPQLHHFCTSCLSPWLPSSEASGGCCSNRSCQVVSTLLTCDTVKDPQSRVFGCPVFRACPKCYSLIMHTKGCKYVTCPTCHHRFCFMCLQRSEECQKAKDLYWSLSCTKPMAERQRFLT